MLEFLIASILNCSDAQRIMANVEADDRLSEITKAELVQELTEHSDCDRNANVD